MGRMGDGYGSECHLLRWMGRHRREFDKRAGLAIGSGLAAVEWLDCGFSRAKTWSDSEIKGLDFLAPNDPTRVAWEAEWPQTGNVHNWDAVGQFSHQNEKRDWVLVEAKAHVAELKGSPCGAKSHGGRPKIQRFFDHAKVHLGVPATVDWLTDYYQYANRVALLSFLASRGVSAHLLFVYFTGEQRAGWVCPASQQAWQPHLTQMKAHLGLPATHVVSGRIHELFRPVA